MKGGVGMDTWKCVKAWGRVNIATLNGWRVMISCVLDAMYSDIGGIRWV